MSARPPGWYPVLRLGDNRPLTSTFTTEFGHEYEQERGRWLRRRFLWYAGVSMALNTLGLLFVLLTIVGLLFFSQMAQESADEGQSAVPAEVMPEEPSTGDEGESLVGRETEQQDASSPAEEPERETRGPIISGSPGAIAAMLTQMGLTVPSLVIAILLYFIAFRRVRRSSMSREELLSLVTRLIIYTGAIGTLSSVLSYELLQWTAPDAYTKMRDEGTAVVIGFNTLLSIMLSHFLASLFLPWTPRESLRPIVPLAVLNLGVTVFYAWGDAQSILLAILFSLVIALPGLLVCWLRTSRFRSKFHFKMVTRRYGEMKTELDAARQIHDAMFPLPIEEGPIRMRYAYEPMRQIGGDYLFAHRVDTEAGEGRGLLVVLLDVTGHGISAALTVNRLQGEIERQVSMDRSVTPGSVLSALNDYLHHTLARHSVYATALVLRFDADAGTLVWASAGHPPGFLCTVDGTIHHIESTTIVLGATRGEHFQSVEESLPFGRGDTVLAYTDGTIEAKNELGRMLRIEGVEKFLAGHCRVGEQDEDVPKLLLEYVNGFRAGPAQDDSLIVEVRRPLS